MELFKLFGTIAINNQEANKGIDETTGKASSAQTKMVDAFKKIGTAVVTYFAVDKIADFGKACIDAAADANAMASQFTQVFGELEGQAAENLSGIADAAGIAETRMKSSYTKIAAFAKTTGMDTADALSIADRAMVAVADSAAFYDRTLEETTESLQSFLKGNFANDAALGLSCTEVTRNAAATKLFGKEYKNLSEQQKQLTLLKMVEDANALSGALGQAARESETWTNQTGNLQQAWTDFKALIGSNFLDAAVGGVMRATEMVQGLGDKVSDLFEFWREIIAPALDDASRAGKYLIDSFKPIIQIFTDMLPQSMTAKSGMDIIRDACYLLEAVLQVIYEKLFEVGLWIRTHIPEITETVTYLWQQVQFVWDTIGQPIFDLILSIVGKLKDTFAQYMPQIKTFVQQCFGDIQKFWINNLKPCLEAIGTFIETVLAPVFDTVFNTLIVTAVETAFDGIKNLWEYTLKPVFTGITDFLTGIFTLDFQMAWDGICNIVKGAVNGVITGIEGLVNGAIRMINGLIERINSMSSLVKAMLGIPAHINSIQLLSLPRLEEGGILEKGQMGLLEGNGAEAVVPLDQNSAWISAVARDMEAAGIGGNNQQTQRIIDLLELLVESMPDTMKEAFASMKFDVNNREFARLVKAVG